MRRITHADSTKDQKLHRKQHITLHRGSHKEVCPEKARAKEESCGPKEVALDGHFGLQLENRALSKHAKLGSKKQSLIRSCLLLTWDEASLIELGGVLQKCLPLKDARGAAIYAPVRWKPNVLGFFRSL